MRARILLLLSTSAFCFGAQAAEPSHRCAKDAINQARRLIEFHAGPEILRHYQVEMDTNVRVLPPVRNPMNPKQSFEVIEIWGSIYRGQTRVRLLYAPIKSECWLAGQEVLDWSSY